MPADVITVEFYSQAEPDKLLAAADLPRKRAEDAARMVGRADLQSRRRGRERGGKAADLQAVVTSSVTFGDSFPSRGSLNFAPPPLIGEALIPCQAGGDRTK